MYKVMIVDDERFVRRSIINQISWNDLDLEMIAEAGNGQEAHSLINALKPDIILVDIKMPLMNGIDLIRLVKQDNPDTQFVILSGHDDFSYTKEAIKLGVANYIKKPINAKELYETLRLLIERLNEKQNQEKRIFQLTQQVQESIMTLNEKLLNEIIHGSIESLNKNNRFKNDCFALLMLYSPTTRPVPIYFPTSIENINNHIKKIIEAANSSNMEYTVFKDQKADGTLCILFNSSDIKMTILKNIACSLRDICQSSIAVSPMCKNVINIPTIYKATMNILKYKILLDEKIVIDNTILHIRSADKNFSEYIFHSLDLIHKAVENRNFKEADTILTQVLSTDNKKKFSVELLESIIADLANTLTKIMIRYDIHPSKFNYKNIFQTNYILDFDNLSELQKDLSMTIYELFINFTQLDENNIAEKIIQYISIHYHENLSLPQIALEFYMNPSYISQLFKNKTGINLWKYIENIRIDNAKELLSNYNFDISRVAMEVGYNDSSYFSKVFKKRTGLSPIKFQSRIKK